MTKTQKKLWAGLVVLALVTPIGIILPRLLNSGDAWGEWGTETLEKLVGFVPEGLKKYAEFWKAPVPGYNFGGGDGSMAVQLVSYIVSGIIGIIAVALVIYIIYRLVLKNGR
jgi:cobalt/nickel transport protein